ncbi:MAG: general secretion pathway protein GspK [Deltaproteobacteria bacterium]|nr:general secretion pathway protein GspK [Deltaproteobacteria bacterium]
MKDNLQSFFREHRGERGSIAILSLWAVTFLAILAVAVGGLVSANSDAANRIKWMAKSFAVSGRVFEEALSIIKDDKTQGYDGIEEGWADDKTRFKDISFDGVHYSLLGREGRFGLTDEEGKININRVPADVLSKVFQIMGQMTPSEAENFSLSLVDWRDANVVKEGGKENETEECEKLQKPYSCKNADLEAMEELWWIPGMSAKVFEKIRGAVTIYGLGQVNINTADVDTLRCLGLSYGGAQTIAGSRKNVIFEQTLQIGLIAETLGLGGEDKAELERAVSLGLLGVRSDVYRGNLVIDFGGQRRKSIGFVVNRNGELKSWNE